jgi:hypothetical protein
MPKKLWSKGGNNMHQRVRARAAIIIFVIAFAFLWAKEGSCQAQSQIMHHGFSKLDRLMQCMREIYGKIPARYPLMAAIQTDRCPSNKEELLAFLKEKELRIFETEKWIYLIEKDHFMPYRQDPEPVRWSQIKIIPISHSHGNEFSEQEKNSIIDSVLRDARMIPLYTGNDQDKEEIEIKFNIQLVKKRLNPNAPEYILILMEQIMEQVPDRGRAIGRFVCGEMRNGMFYVLWDSRLFAALADIQFEDVNSDGWQEIVVQSETGGTIGYPVWVIFNKDGKEITRQKKCDTSMVVFGEEDGVCSIMGRNISFNNSSNGLKDIVVDDWFSRLGKTTIFKLQNGVYLPQLPKPQQVPRSKNP